MAQIHWTAARHLSSYPLNCVTKQHPISHCVGITYGSHVERTAWVLLHTLCWYVNSLFYSYFHPVPLMGGSAFHSPLFRIVPWNPHLFYFIYHSYILISNTVMKWSPHMIARVPVLTWVNERDTFILTHWHGFNVAFQMWSIITSNLNNMYPCLVSWIFDRTTSVLRYFWEIVQYHHEGMVHQACTSSQDEELLDTSEKL